jgi:hypothetical protein
MYQYLEFRNEWTEKCRKMSDEELIASFNSKVGLRTYGMFLSILLSTQENEMLRRNWDLSEVTSTDPKTNRKLAISYAYPIQLVDNKIIVIKNYFWFKREIVYLN